MMMDDKPRAGDDEQEDGAEQSDEAGIESKSGTQRAGGGDTRRTVDGGGDTR